MASMGTLKQLLFLIRTLPDTSDDIKVELAECLALLVNEMRAEVADMLGLP